MLGGAGGGSVRSSNPKHSKAPQPAGRGGSLSAAGISGEAPQRTFTQKAHICPPPHLLSGGGRCSGLTPRTQDGSQNHKIVANLVPVKSKWREGPQRHDKAGTQRAAPRPSSPAPAPPPQLPRPSSSTSAPPPQLLHLTLHKGGLVGQRLKVLHVLQNKYTAI